MTRYSVAEAKNHLSRILTEAEAGEPVSITRRGKVIADIVPRAAKPPFRIDIEALRQRRVIPAKGPIDTLAVLEEMRSEQDG